VRSPPLTARLAALAAALLGAGCVVTGADRATRESWWFDVSAGFQTTCGHSATGLAECWGELETAVPQLPFTQIDAGYRAGCGLSGGEITCWADERPSLLNAPAGPHHHVSTLAAAACAVAEGGALACWGDPSAVVTDAPGGAYARVAVGENFACALGEDQDLACWGDAEAGEATPPAGNFEAVDAGANHACALSAEDGSLVCWGEGDYAALGGDYQDLAVGWDYSCGLDWSGVVACRFGDGGAFDPAPDATFVSIDGGYRHVCGVTDDGRALCWGLDELGEARVPHNPVADDDD
jgi:hypothetical protein